jgi:predicted transposase YdaD
VPGRFDNTTRYLVQAYPADWLSFLGHAPTGEVEVIDSNLSTVSAEADKVVRVGDATPWLVHLEFQTSYDPTMGRRLVRYNAMLHLQHELPVASVLVLLRPEADGRSIDGEYRVALPGSEPYLTFAYSVRRIWQEPARHLLAGPLGTLPLAPLGAVREAALPGLLRRIDQRFEREATIAEAGRLRVVTYTLLGLKYPTAVIDEVMPGLEAMRDSSTYQAILDEGRTEEALELLLELGTGRFGPPDARTRATLTAIDDRAQLHALAARLFAVSSWTELLAGPA